jgi:aspartate kinase
MIVLKFGGTSVSTKERIQTICDIVSSKRSQQPIVVVSAIRGITDLLLSLLSANKTQQKDILHQIEIMHIKLVQSYFGNDSEDIVAFVKKCVGELKGILQTSANEKELADKIVSYGEILSSYIIAAALRHNGIIAKQIIASQLIVTNNNFTNADFIPDKTKEKIKKVLVPVVEKNVVPVVTGFIGATTNGKVTTLGRGGSDYSAAIVGYGLSVDEIQIWTDVDGIYTADPRIVPTAILLPDVTYREASELAAFGGKILHPRTIRPAISAGIPVRVLNTLNPESHGTMIETTQSRMLRITAVASKKKVMLINLYSTDMLLHKGFLERIFGVFARHDISVDLVSVSEVSVSVTLDNTDNLQNALDELTQFTSVSTRETGIVSIIGENIVAIPEIMRNIFTVLSVANIHVHMISLGASAINISVVINTDDVSTVVRLLHDSVLVRTVAQERSYL